MYNLQTIAIDDLKRCPISFRPVCKETLEYVQLRDSIRDIGILVPLLVRPHNEVVDGNNRYEVARDLRLPGVPCNVREMTDDQVLQLQLVIHSSSIEVSTVEYARRLWRIVEVEKSFSLNELATYIRQHPDWLRRRLNLVNLSPKAQFYLTDGLLGVIIAIELSKLPHGRQDAILKYVGNMPTAELKDMVIEEARHHREGIKYRRVHRQKSQYQFRSFKEVVSELEKPTVAATVLNYENATTPLEGWTAGLQWALKNDSATVAEVLKRREKEQARKADLLKRRSAEHLERKREQNE